MEAIHTEDGRDVLFMEIEVYEGHMDFFILKPRSWNLDNTVHEQDEWFHGFVKWDGCTEISCIHLCDRRDFGFYHKALDAIYENAIKHFPNFQVQG
jgi:hypothetical protein